MSRKHLPAAVLVSIGCSVAFRDAPRAFTARTTLWDAQPRWPLLGIRGFDPLLLLFDHIVLVTSATQDGGR